jgi:hypothetical protein
MYTIIDGWNIFTYDGIPNDTEDKKTIAVKHLGDNTAEIMLDVKTMRFQFIKNGELWLDTTRFSSAISVADKWFSSFEN